MARSVGQDIAAGARAGWAGMASGATAAGKQTHYAGRVAFHYAPVIAAVFVGALTITAKTFDSFNLSDNADATVEKAVSLVSGPFYGGFKREGQSAITVVLINQDTLADWNNPFWPVRYDHTASLVEAVAAMKPRAIFVDFTFGTPHPPRPCGASMLCAQNPNWELDDLARRLAEVGDSGVPVLLGPVGGHSAFVELAKTPQVGIALQDTRAFAYPMTSTQKDPAGRPRPMAATALYEIWRRGLPSGARPPPAADSVLSVEWGFGMSSDMANYSPEARERAPCRGADLGERIASFARLTARSAFPTLVGRDALYMPCAYSDVLPAHAVIAPEFSGALKPLIEDRIVLIGADVTYLRDYMPTPLFGEAPGVMVHAMALDNLIEHGSSTTRYPRPVFEGTGLDEGDLVEFGLLLLGLLMIWWVRYRRRISYRRSLRWRHRIGIWLIVACIGVAISCALHWPMFKLLGAAIIGAGAMAMSDLIRQFVLLRDGHAAVRAAYLPRGDAS